jgi:hypothetical protein
MAGPAICRNDGFRVKWAIPNIVEMRSHHRDRERPPTAVAAVGPRVVHEQAIGNPDIDEIIPERHPEQLFVTNEPRNDILFERAARTKPIDQGPPKK